MPAFTDANGKEWTVSLDAYKIRDVRQEVKDCDGKPMDLAPPDMNPYDALQADVVLVADTLWVLVRDQATEGYSSRDFGKALNGDAMDRATEALIQAIVGFSRPQQRGLLTKAIEANKNARSAGVELATEHLDDPRVLEAMKLAMKERMETEIKTALEKLTGPKSASSTPGSAG